MAILAKDIMTPNPSSCYRYISLDRVIEIMEKKEDGKVSYIVLTDEHSVLLGISSRWNIARFILKFNISEENLTNIPINNIMQINVISKDVETPFEQVIENVISTNSECMICTETKRGENFASVKGIICKRDVLAGISDIILHSRDIKRYADDIIAEDLMNTKVKDTGICYKYEDVIDVKKRMAENNIKHVCVINEINDKQKLIKVISYKDLIDIKTSNAISEIKTKREDEISKRKLGDLQNKEKFSQYNDKTLIACSKNTNLSKLIELMMVCHVGVIPVIDEDDTLLGIIGRKEIFEAFLFVLDDCKRNNIDFDELVLHTQKLTEIPEAQPLQTNTNSDTNLNKIMIPRFAIDVISPMQRQDRGQENGKVICCGTNEKVNDVGLSMKNNNISHVVITSDGTDNGALLGIISARDITIYRRIMDASGANIDDTPIRDFANPLCPSVIYCSKYTSFPEIVETMVKNNIGSMIVMGKENINVEEETNNMKGNLNQAEEDMRCEIENEIPGLKHKSKFFETIGEEYIRMITNITNSNADVTKISTGIMNILKTYLSLTGLKLNEEINKEITEKFKNRIEKEISLLLSKIPEEKFSSSKDMEIQIEKLISDLKKYIGAMGITKQKEQSEVIERIMDDEKNAIMAAFEGDIPKTCYDCDGLIIKLKEGIHLKDYFIHVLKWKINNILLNIAKMQFESKNVEDEINSINNELAKILAKINMQEDKLENCKTIMAKTLWIIADSHKKVANLKSISDKFAAILNIYIESAYSQDCRGKIMEVWNKKAKNVSENFRYGLYKIIRGKIVGFISRSDVLRGIKTTLSFLHLPFIENEMTKKDIAKICAKAEDIIMNKNVKDVKTCNATDKIIKVDGKMCKFHIGHICVVHNENELIGIASYDDFVPTIICPAAVLSSSTMEKTMSKNSELFVCDKDTLLEDLIEIIVVNKIGAIPVVEKKVNDGFYRHHENVFDELIKSISEKKRSVSFIPVIGNKNMDVNKGIDFLNPAQNLQSQNYTNTLLKDMYEGRITKILLLKQISDTKTSIFATGINKEYNRKFKEGLKNKKLVEVKQQFRKFNEMLKYISIDRRISGIIIENEDEDMFKYRYLLKGIICKKELFESGMNVIKIIDNLTT
ncbi:MAG: hypothetical protein CVT88_04250 [Candidatus Altiarchaeales archaeon HGW-Altiarchaeales-1]|nr:MAG: hypothetical protein CVT88_04250 [Candidatus Altiarchaeales archaeon HGW-Altiarchaeales-1]